MSRIVAWLFAALFLLPAVRVRADSIIEFDIIPNRTDRGLISYAGIPPSSPLVGSKIGVDDVTAPHVPLYQLFNHLNTPKRKNAKSTLVGEGSLNFATGNFVSRQQIGNTMNYVFGPGGTFSVTGGLHLPQKSTSKGGPYFNPKTDMAPTVLLQGSFTDVSSASLILKGPSRGWGTFSGPIDVAFAASLDERFGFRPGTHFVGTYIQDFTGARIILKKDDAFGGNPGGGGIDLSPNAPEPSSIVQLSAGAMGLGCYGFYIWRRRPRAA